MTATLDAQRTRLMQAMRFRKADLEANRDGRLSSRQRDYLSPPKISGVTRLVIIGHLVVVGGLLGAVAVISGSTSMLVVLVIVIALAGMPLLLVTSGEAGRPLLHHDVKKGQVRAAHGPLEKSRETGRTPRYRITVDGVTFQVTRRVFYAFEDDAHYRLYYLPNSKLLLSAEPDEGLF